MRSDFQAFRPPRPLPREQPLGPIALLKALRTNAIDCWTKAHFEQPIVVGGFPFAKVAVVSHPAAIRKVLVENPNTYRKSALERRILSPRLRNGLVSVEGEQWAKQRRTLAPLFGRKTVSQFVPAMQDAATALVERWGQHPSNEPIELKTEMSALALDGLVRSIFREGFAGGSEAIRDAMVTFFTTMGRIDPFDVIGLPDFIPRVSQWRVRAMLRSFDQTLDGAIAERRQSLADDPGEAACDMLAILLSATDPETGARMSEAEVKANILTFVFAGQETTSTTLTWVLYLLSQSPEWSARVTAESERELEGARAGAIERLVEARAAIEEALRLYPPVIGITRTASRRDNLAGHSIERGTMIVISPYVLHRHVLLWNDPDTFNPGRFLEPEAGKIDRYAYLPFGVGPRMCIGAGFALQEATLVLATIMRDFMLVLAPGQSVWPLLRFTLRPRDPLLMTVRRRRLC